MSLSYGNVLKSVFAASLLATATYTAGYGPISPSPEQLRTAAVTLSRPSGEVFCTGVAVGEHTILTQKHCLEATPVILYNGKRCETDVQVASDGTENVLVRTCQRYRVFKRLMPTSHKIGERFSHFGHPYGVAMMYREGVLVLKGDGVDFRMPPGTVYIFDMNATGGDSGGPIYDSWGRLVCTVSFGIHAPGDGFTVTACYLPKFTKQQLKEIK